MRAFGDADAGERPDRIAPLLRGEQPAQPAPQRDRAQTPGQNVGQHGEAADEVELLEHEADLPAQAADVGGDAAVALDGLAKHADRAAATVTGDQAADM